MDFGFSPEQERLRQEVTDFLDAELKTGAFKPMHDPHMHNFSREFSIKLGKKGWLGMTWPKEFGGQGRSFVDRNIVVEELFRRGAPVGAHWIGDRQIGPSLIAYGSKELRDEFLPRIISGEVVFAIGMSEPESGSDLASLKTRATEKNGYLVVDGQKLWTSHAHLADYCYMVVRTDPNVPKHRGISELIVDMRLPGITIRPLMDMSGHTDLCEVFFDNVKVPAKYLVGEKNRGWHQILSQLDYERGNMDRLMGNHLVFEFLCNFVKELKSTGKVSERKLAIIRDKLARLKIEFEIGRLLVYRLACIFDEGRLPHYEAPVAKDFCTQYEKHLDDAAMEILGLYGQLTAGSKLVPAQGLVASSYLFSPARSLQGGTTETLRNIIATKGLGLPA